MAYRSRDRNFSLRERRFMHITFRAMFSEEPQQGLAQLFAENEFISANPQITHLMPVGCPPMRQFHHFPSSIKSLYSQLPAFIFQGCGLSVLISCHSVFGNLSCKTSSRRIDHTVA